MKTVEKLIIPLIITCLSIPLPAQTSGNSASGNKLPAAKKERTVKTRKKPIETKTWMPEVLEKKTFGIEITRMFTPGGIVNLSRPGLFLLKSGRMQANLPYVGRFRAPNLAIAYKRTVDIDAPAIDYKIYPTRRGFRVRYKIFQVGENFDVELRIDRNGYTSVYLYSSLRSDIRYSGSLKMLRF